MPPAQHLNGQLAQVIIIFNESSRVGVTVLHTMSTRGAEKKSIKQENVKVMQLTPKLLLNRAMSWYVWWFMETRDLDI